MDVYKQVGTLVIIRHELFIWLMRILRGANLESSFLFPPFRVLVSHQNCDTPWPEHGMWVPYATGTKEILSALARGHLLCFLLDDQYPAAQTDGMAPLILKLNYSLYILKCHLSLLDSSPSE